MPLFGSKFSPKKAPQRKTVPAPTGTDPLENIVTKDGAVHLKLGDQKTVFSKGNWAPEKGENSHIHKANQKFKARIHELEEENNLLRLKYEILLNMLTQSTAESHMQQRELERLKHLAIKK